jgi:hypothetical protein
VKEKSVMNIKIKLIHYSLPLLMAIADVQQQPDTKTSKARLDYAVTQLLRKLPK